MQPINAVFFLPTLSFFSSNTSHCSSRILKHNSKISFVIGAFGFQTSPIRRWHPNMNLLKNRLFVDEFGMVELIPLSDTKLGPTPLAQVCTKFEYIDLSFRMVSYWTLAAFLPLSNERMRIPHTRFIPQTSACGYGPRRGIASNSDLSISWSDKCRFTNHKLEETVDLSLAQNESIVARLMHIDKSSSAGQSRFLSLPRMVKKWHRSHWKGAIKWSPSLATINWVASSLIKYSSSTKELSRSLTDNTGNISFGCWKKHAACQAP